MGCHGDDKDKSFSDYFFNLRKKEGEGEGEGERDREIQYREFSSSADPELREGEGEEPAGGEEPSLSPVERAAVDILERVPHYLTHSSLSLCVLDSLLHCLHSLSHTHTTLLPLVHKVRGQ